MTTVVTPQETFMGLDEAAQALQVHPETLSAIARTGADRPKERFISRQQFARLESCLPENLRPIARFAVETGLRQSNVLGLLWSDVNLHTRTLTICGSRTKSGRLLHIPLSDAALSVLRGQIGRHHESVFVGPGGEPYASTPKRAWATATAKAGLHGLR